MAGDLGLFAAETSLRQGKESGIVGTEEQAPVGELVTS